MRRQRSNRDRADFLQREIKDHELSHVGQGQHHRVQRTQPQVQQVEREALAQTIDIGVGVLAPAIDDKHTRCKFLEDIGEFIAQAAVLPITLGAVACGKLRGKGYDSFYHRDILPGSG